MKFSTSPRHIRKKAKSLKIDTSGLEIKTEKEDNTTPDANSIILLFQTFNIYAQILIFLAVSSNKQQLQLALGKYDKYLIMLWEIYT